jgi:hypothetical protein
VTIIVLVEWFHRRRLGDEYTNISVYDPVAGGIIINKPQSIKCATILYLQLGLGKKHEFSEGKISSRIPFSEPTDS